jgi:hypothetical protein
MRDMLHTRYRSSYKAKTACRRARKQNEKQKQQSSEQLVDDTGRLDDDASMSSSCWGSSKDSLGFECLLGDDVFDIDVF